MNKKTRIAYLEDLKVVREGVNFLLSQYRNFEIIDQDLEPQDTEEYILLHKPDIFILDLQLSIPREPNSHLNGFEICHLISRKFPSIKVIAHTMFDNIENVNKFFNNGGMGFVSKKSGHQELVNAIKSVTENKRYVCPDILKQSKNSERFLNNEDENLKANHDLFTKAEKSVLERIAKGYSTKQIAHQLEVSEKTVETHRKHLFDKAGVKNVAELIAFVYSRRIFMD
jgi:DNA-binding NarL/FixJ family response regulator